MNTRMNSIRVVAIAALVIVVCMAASARAQTTASSLNDNSFRNRSPFRLDLFRLPARTQSFSLRPAGFRLMAETGARINSSATTPMAVGLNLQVFGAGTLGRLTKWTGFTSSNSTIGDSTIFEDKFGNVGIGTDTPTSKLTVAGTLTVSGTIQSSGGASVLHNTTLTGNGTSAAPLGIQVPLRLDGSGIRTLGVFNDSFLGDGIRSTGGESGTGVVGLGGRGVSVNSHGGVGVQALGGNTDSGNGGDGLTALGGFSGRSQGVAGEGVVATGGEGTGPGSAAGAGLSATGGFSADGLAGDGVRAQGGNSITGSAGIGIVATGGILDTGSQTFGSEGLNAHGGNADSGGIAIMAVGGDGNGAGHHSGDAIVARSGRALGGATPGRAGLFIGDVSINGDLRVSNDVQINGNLSVSGTKNFKIDHPLDPENRYLLHAAIESSEVLNVYSGNVTANKEGEAVVTLPEWFEALNKDFRYQLTPIGAPAQGLYIAEKIGGNRFKIAGARPGMEVSWQVTGVRSDAVMRKHPFKAEEQKPESERGHYVDPEAYGQPEERSVNSVRNPEKIRDLNERRAKQAEESKRKTESGVR